MCKLKTCIGKVIGNANIRFKTMNNHISESMTGVSSCKFSRHIKRKFNGNLLP